MLFLLPGLFTIAVLSICQFGISSLIAKVMFSKLPFWVIDVSFLSGTLTADLSTQSVSSKESILN